MSMGSITVSPAGACERRQESPPRRTSIPVEVDSRFRGNDGEGRGNDRYGGSGDLSWVGVMVFVQS